MLTLWILVAFVVAVLGVDPLNRWLEAHRGAALRRRAWAFTAAAAVQVGCVLAIASVASCGHGGEAGGGYTAEEWIKIIGAIVGGLGVLVGSIGGLVVTIQGNRARLAAEERAARAADHRGEQLRAVAERTGAPVLPPPADPPPT